MLFPKSNSTLVQKIIQRVLEERNLCLQKVLNLESPKPKHFNCGLASNCKMCEKRHRCDSCKTPYEHSSIFSKTKKCEVYV